VADEPRASSDELALMVIETAMTVFRDQKSVGEDRKRGSSEEAAGG
jgi:hypothetical protein